MFFNQNILTLVLEFATEPSVQLTQPKLTYQCWSGKLKSVYVPRPDGKQKGLPIGRVLIAVNELFGSGEGRVRKGLHFHDDDGMDSESQNLKAKVAAESVRAVNAETEVQTLKDALAKLEAEKE